MYAIYCFCRKIKVARDWSEVIGAPGSICSNEEGIVGASPGEVDGMVGGCYRGLRRMASAASEGERSERSDWRSRERDRVIIVYGIRR